MNTFSYCLLKGISRFQICICNPLITLHPYAEIYSQLGVAPSTLLALAVKNTDSEALSFLLDKVQYIV